MYMKKFDNIVSMIADDVASTEARLNRQYSAIDSRKAFAARLGEDAKLIKHSAKALQRAGLSTRMLVESLKMTKENLQTNEDALKVTIINKNYDEELLFLKRGTQYLVEKGASND